MIPVFNHCSPLTLQITIHSLSKTRDARDAFSQPGANLDFARCSRLATHRHNGGIQLAPAIERMGTDHDPCFKHGTFIEVRISVVDVHCGALIPIGTKVGQRASDLPESWRHY